MPEQITFIQSLILGIVEGVTEFLPISSTGHLLVCSQLIGAANTSGTFEIVIQLGAIIAVVIYYWKRLWEKALQLLKGGSQAFDWRSESSSAHFWISLFLAFLPAAVVGLLVHDWIDILLGDGKMQAYVIAATLFIGGIILLIVDRDPADRQSSATETELNNESEARSECALTYKQALWIGVAQCFSLIPGVSRSGSTIVGGLLVGLNRSQATDFSFFLSIPTLGAATVYTLVRNYQKVVEIGGLGALSVGTVVSFVTAFAAIGWLLRYVSSNNFRGFAYYRMAAGLVIALWAWFCFAS
ncbi:MAG: undecaprenyl-diphosphate phosphatase [Candidatus Bruticola sp.]